LALEVFKTRFKTDGIAVFNDKNTVNFSFETSYRQLDMSKKNRHYRGGFFVEPRGPEKRF